MYLRLLSDLFYLSIILSHFLSDDILFNPGLFFSSITLGTGNPILFSKISTFISFCSIFISLSSIVSPIMFIACSKTLFCIKALCPILDCIEYDCLLYFSVACVILVSNLESFFYNIYKLNHLLGRELLFD